MNKIVISSFSGFVMLAIVAMGLVMAPISAHAEGWDSMGKNSHGVGQYMTSDGTFLLKGTKDGAKPYYGVANATGSSPDTEISWIDGVMSAVIGAGGEEGNKAVKVKTTAQGYHEDVINLKKAQDLFNGGAPFQF